MLRLGELEVAEDQEKDEKIVGAEGKFEDVSGGEFEGGGVSLPGVENYGERGGEGDPDGTPGERLAESEGASAAVEDAEVEGQHGRDEGVEENPG